jgi:hypothetical protein
MELDNQISHAVDMAPDRGSGDGIQTRPIRTRTATRSRSRSTSLKPATASLTTRSTYRKLAPKSTIESPAKEYKGKGKATRSDGMQMQPIEVTSDDEDDDKPVFVGQKAANRLAAKYNFIPGEKPFTTSRTKGDIIKVDSKGKGKATDEKPQPPPLPLRPPSPPREPLAVPSWLSRTAFLLQLPKCVVCNVTFKKTDSGAGRWVRDLDNGC